MNKLILTLIAPAALTFSCLGMHNYNNLPTPGQEPITQQPNMQVDEKKLAAHKQREQDFDWQEIPQEQADTNADLTEQKSNAEAAANINYGQFVYDEIFALTGLPKELQKTVKDYLELPIKFMPAFTYKRALTDICPNDPILMISNRYLAKQGWADDLNLHLRNSSIWDMQTGQCIQALVHNATIPIIFALQDGSLVMRSYESNPPSLRILNPLTGMLLQTIITPHTEVIRFGDGIATRWENTITIWDTKTGKEKQTIMIPNSLTEAILEIKDLTNNEILIRPVSGKLIVWNEHAGFRTLDLELHFSQDQADRRPNDKLTIMSNGLMIISTFAVNTLTEPLPVANSDNPSKILLRVYDPVQEKVIMQTAQIAFSVKDNILAMTDGKAIEIWDSATGKSTKDADACRLVQLPITFADIQVINNTRVLLQDHRNRLYIYDMPERQIIKIRNVVCQPTNNHQISPDGKSIAMSSSYTMGELFTDLTTTWTPPQEGLLYIFTQNEEAIAALHNLSTERKIILAKLIAEFDKNPGILHKRGTKPKLLTGETLTQFIALPKAIQRCLLSNYDIETEEDDLRDSGMSLCTIL